MNVKGQSLCMCMFTCVGMYTVVEQDLALPRQVSWQAGTAVDVSAPPHSWRSTQGTIEIALDICNIRTYFRLCMIMGVVKLIIPGYKGNSQL